MPPPAGSYPNCPKGPYVTVSRQLGTGGRELARRLAERLGWQLFDKEIILAIAEQTHTREKIISRLDEKAIGMFDDLLARWFSADSVGPSDFVREMMQVIWALARNGQAVLVGRGANWLLDPRYGLRVRIVAPRMCASSPSPGARRSTRRPPSSGSGRTMPPRPRSCGSGTIATSTIRSGTTSF